MATRLPVSFTAEQARTIADTRYGLRFRTAADAVRFLLDLGAETLRSMPAAERTRRSIKAGAETIPDDDEAADKGETAADAPVRRKRGSRADSRK